MFPIIFLFSNNINTPTEEIIFPIIVTLLITFVMWVILKKVLKNQNKSTIIITVGIILFFSYGHLFEVLNSNYPSFFIFYIHLSLLILYLSIFGLFSFFIIRGKWNFNNLVKILNAVGITLVIFPIIVIGQFFIIDSNYDLEQNIYEKNENLSIDKLPDVYYIIPDAYAGSKALKKVFNYDNSDFQNFLYEKGFNISEESYSNYMATRFSIPSTLNMKYLNYIYNDTKSVNFMDRELYKVSHNPEVISKFKSLGYNTYVIESGVLSWDTPTSNIKNADYRLCNTTNILGTEFMSILIQTTVINPVQAKLFAKDHRDKILCGFSELNKLSENSDSPKFVLVHIMAPHPPYVFGSNGEELNPKNLKQNDIENNYDGDFYLGQLEFVNLMMKESINKILSTKNSPIIIIESDHGLKEKYFEDEKSVFLGHFNNFKAYYFPNIGKNPEFEESMPVNSFRILFNIYFNEDYEILENKIYTLEDNKYKFREITGIFD